MIHIKHAAKFTFLKTHYQYTYDLQRLVVNFYLQFRPIHKINVACVWSLITAKMLIFRRKTKYKFSVNYDNADEACVKSWVTHTVKDKTPYCRRRGAIVSRSFFDTCPGLGRVRTAMPDDRGLWLDREGFDPEARPATAEVGWTRAGAPATAALSGQPPSRRSHGKNTRRYNYCSSPSTLCDSLARRCLHPSLLLLVNLMSNFLRYFCAFKICKLTMSA